MRLAGGIGTVGERVSRFLAAALALACLAPGGCAPEHDASQVVVYTSVDQVYAQDVFKRFTRRTGIRVLPVYDTEAGKTTGLYRRLLAERGRPRADVFWNGEICRTIQLAEAGLAGDLSALVPEDLPRRWVDPKGRWAAFGQRARILFYNTKLVAAADAPRRFSDLAQPRWRGKAAMANPLFGTAATHAAALYERLGETQAEKLFRALKVNEVRLVEGNSVVRDMVARGELPVGAFVIPNTVMLLAGGPHPETAQGFVRFLLQAGVERQLAFSRARLIPARDGVDIPEELRAFAGMTAMQVDYANVAARMPETAKRMERIFLQ